MLREQVWASFNNVKFKSFYMSGLLRRYQRMDRNINMFLAIASSGSIAAWAVWQKVPMLWATIVALSQVTMAVKPYVPYFKYVKELNSKGRELDVVIIRFEQLWHRIQGKKLSDDEIEAEYFKLRADSSTLLSFSDDTILPRRKKVEDGANREMQTWLKAHFKTEIQIDAR